MNPATRAILTAGCTLPDMTPEQQQLLIDRLEQVRQRMADEMNRNTFCGVDLACPAPGSVVNVAYDGSGYLSAPPASTLRELHLNTHPGQSIYDLHCFEPVHSAWGVRDNFHFLLVQHEHVPETNVTGVPTAFAFHGSFLRLYPAPNAVYRIGFVQGVAPPREVHTWRDYQMYVGPGRHDPEAEHKSIALLKTWLSPTQLEQFNKSEAFDVTGSKTKKTYRITKNPTYGVHELNANGQTARRLCFLPTDAYSIGDIMLAQKIALEQDEPRVLKICNFSPPVPRTSDTVYFEETAEVEPSVWNRWFRNNW